MSKKRRSFGAAFEANVVTTAAQLAAKFAVHGNQVSSWKKRLLEGVADLFVDNCEHRSRP